MTFPVIKMLLFKHALCWPGSGDVHLKGAQFRAVHASFGMSYVYIIAVLDSFQTAASMESSTTVRRCSLSQL